MNALERFWFAPAPARRLAWLRILIGGWCFAGLVIDWRHTALVARTPVDRFKGVGVTALLDGPVAPWVSDVIVVFAIVFGALFVLGYFYRVSAPIFGLLLLVTYTIRNSWGMKYHVHNLQLLHVMVLSVLPAAHQLSLDRWRGARGLPDDEVHARYGWSVHLLQAVTVIPYFIAGVAKLTSEAGWSWIAGANLRDQIALDALYKELITARVPTTALFIYEHSRLLVIGAVATLVLELGAPLVLLDRRLGYVWSAGALAMHWGIIGLMGIVFYYPLSGFAFLPMLPVDLIVTSVRERLRRVT